MEHRTSPWRRGRTTILLLLSGSRSRAASRKTYRRKKKVRKNRSEWPRGETAGLLRGLLFIAALTVTRSAPAEICEGEDGCWERTSPRPRPASYRAAPSIATGWATGQRRRVRRYTDERMLPRSLRPTAAHPERLRELHDFTSRERRTA